MTTFAESVVEEAARAWLAGVGWRIAQGPDIAPGAPRAERSDYGEVILPRRLRTALARLNPDLPAEALEDAFRKLIRPEGADLVTRNRAVHRLLIDGVTVEYRTPDGSIRGAQARVIDFNDIAANDFLAVDQPPGAPPPAPSAPRAGQVAGEVRSEVADEVTEEVQRLLQVCLGEMSRAELQRLGLKGEANFRRL
jgi:hypothetical protein